MKNFKNRQLFKRNYYVVSIDDNYSERITAECVKNIKEKGQYEFTVTYDYNDHKHILPCKIIVEEINTSKDYFEL